MHIQTSRSFREWLNDQLDAIFLLAVSLPSIVGQFVTRLDYQNCPSCLGCRVARPDGDLILDEYDPDEELVTQPYRCICCGHNFIALTRFPMTGGWRRR